MLPVRISRIIKSIEKRREDEIAKILSEAKKKAGEIITDGEKLSEEKKSEIISQFKEERERVRKKELAKIKLENSDALKNAKLEIMEEIISDAVKRAREFSYEKRLEEILEKSVKQLGGKEFEIFVSKKDVNLAKKIVKKIGVKAKIKTIKTYGGCLVKSGRKASNNLIESLAERKRHDLEMVLNEVLFGE